MINSLFGVFFGYVLMIDMTQVNCLLLSDAETMIRGPSPPIVFSQQQQKKQQTKIDTP